jgi:hypothetical protein
MQTVLAGSGGADQQGGQPQLPWWRDDQAAVLPAGQVAAERGAEGVGVQPAGVTVGQAVGLAPGPPLGPLAAAPLGPLELGRDNGGVAVGGAVAGGRGQPGGHGQGQLGQEDRPQRRELDASRPELPHEQRVPGEVPGHGLSRPALEEDHAGAEDHGGDGQVPQPDPGQPHDRRAGQPDRERWQAEQRERSQRIEHGRQARSWVRWPLAVDAGAHRPSSSGRARTRCTGRSWVGSWPRTSVSQPTSPAGQNHQTSSKSGSTSRTMPS